MRIGVVAPMRYNNAYYRGYAIGGLAARGHDVVLHGDETRLSRDRLFAYDVVHIYRLSTRATQQLARELRQAAVAVVWDVDDDLAVVPTEVANWHAKGAAREQRELAQVVAMARLADVVTTTTEPIADFYSRNGAQRVRIVENYLPSVYEPGPPRPHDGIVIGWVAAGEHAHDLEQLQIGQVLTRVLEANADAVVNGVGIDLGLASDRYRHDASVPYRELAAHVAGFDIGIAPLDDTPFNRGRSNVKLKEYAAAGVPWLASPIGPYAGHGEQQGGRLVPDDGWEAALNRLVRKPRERRKLAKRALEWGRAQTVASNLEAWESVLVEAHALARHRRGAPAPRGSSAAR